jgi:hypothetical protein
LTLDLAKDEAMARHSEMAGALRASEFKHAAARFRLSDKALKVARAVLVDGASFDEVCQDYDTSRQLAHQWSTKVYESFRPAGWVTESVTLPPELMQRVREMETEARQRWAQELPPARTVRR